MTKKQKFWWIWLPIIIISVIGPIAAAREPNWQVTQLQEYPPLSRPENLDVVFITIYPDSSVFIQAQAYPEEWSYTPSLAPPLGGQLYSAETDSGKTPTEGELLVFLANVLPIITQGYIDWDQITWTTY